MSARGDRTRARLIEATTQVVAQVGYSRATTRAIADLAGVAEGTIYRHFPDKQQLFFAAVLERNAPIVAWLDGFPALAGTSTVRDNLCDAFGQLGQLRADLLPLELSLRADPELASGLRDMMTAGTRPPAGPGPPSDGPVRLVGGYLAAEQRLGRIRTDVDPSTTAMILLALLFGLAMAPAEPHSPVDVVMIEAAIDLVLGGLEPPR